MLYILGEKNLADLTRPEEYRLASPSNGVARRLDTCNDLHQDGRRYGGNKRKDIQIRHVLPRQRFVKARYKGDGGRGLVHPQHQLSQEIIAKLQEIGGDREA